MSKFSFSVLAIYCLCLLGISCSNHSSQADLSLIPVKSGDQWGYINPKGEYVINPQFSDADFFREGVARVKSSEGKVGYIDKDGKYKIAAEYKDGTPFLEGLAFVVAAGKAPMCIDKSGKEKFTLEQAKLTYVFSEGLARFSTADGKWGYVDKSGKVVINPQFDAANPFSEGLAAVKQNDKWGFINKQGEIVINPQFEWAPLFTEGKSFFSNGKKYGYIDKKGNYVINPQFDAAMIFTDGMARIYSGKKHGYINADGKIEINPQFEDASIFQNGLAAVKQDKDYGFIDKNGKIVINPQFDEVSFFVGNLALVKSGKQWGIINKNGKYVVNPQFDGIKLPKWNVDEWWLSVTSDFYDTSEFINNFFQRAKDNSFDGFNGNSTLQTILDNATYGNGANARYNDEYAVDYKKSQKLTNDISISQVTFQSGSGNQFYTGSYYNKEYNFGAKIYGISYTLYFTGEARDKNEAITNAIIAEVEKRYNIKLKEGIDESGDAMYAWYEGSNDILDFHLILKSNRETEFGVQFKQ